MSPSFSEALTAPTRQQREESTATWESFRKNEGDNIETVSRKRQEIIPFAYLSPSSSVTHSLDFNFWRSDAYRALQSPGGSCCPVLVYLTKGQVYVGYQKMVR